MKSFFTRLLAIIVALSLFAALFMTASALLPFRDFRIQMVWDDVYKGTDDFDYLFVGSSHVYSGINPEIIQKLTGKKAVLLSAGVQTLTETYYTLAEALKYQSPKHVYVDMYAAYKQFDKKDNYMNIDCMKYSDLKMKLAREVFPKIPKEDIIFPLIREHSNWKNGGNIRLNYDMMLWPADYTNGFSGINSVMSKKQVKAYESMAYDGTEFHLRKKDAIAIDKMKKLCKKKNIQITFIMVPWYKGFTDKINYDSVIKALSDEAEFLDFTYPSYRKMWMDETYFIDEKASDNQHLNIEGANLFTEYFAKHILLGEPVE